MLAQNTGIEKTFGALSDCTRMAIVERLSSGEVCLSDLAKPFKMSQTAVTKHVKILSEAGLVQVKKRGRTRYCELLPAPMHEAEQWLETYQLFWSKRMNNLSSFLENEQLQKEET